MFNVPDEFRDIPEAVKVREAQARFDAAIEQEKRATQQSGERVHLMSGQLRHVQEELKRAQDAFDAATGEPNPARLTPAVVEEVAKHFHPPQHAGPDFEVFYGQPHKLKDSGVGFYVGNFPNFDPKEGAKRFSGRLGAFELDWFQTSTTNPPGVYRTAVFDYRTTIIIIRDKQLKREFRYTQKIHVWVYGPDLLEVQQLTAFLSGLRQFRVKPEVAAETVEPEEQTPLAEIFDYGIYLGGHDESVANANAPTGQVLLGGPVRLEKKTDQIPPKLKSKFGLRFVVHGKPDDAPVKLHLVYLFPEMKDPTSGQKLKRFEMDILAKPEAKKLQMLWDFTEPYELVTGEWTFQVFRGEDKLLEKKFEVVKADGK